MGAAESSRRLAGQVTPTVTADPDRSRQVDLFDPDTQECPYNAYQLLREIGPWLDPRSEMFILSRYEDIREVLVDPERFPSGGRIGTGKTDRLLEVYRSEGGWVPARTLAGRDDPEHRQLRKLFQHAFRPSRIDALESEIRDLAHTLIDGFVEEGRCDWVRQFAVPLPLIVIGRQMGAEESDIWRIKAWTDAWVQRLGMMQTEEEAIRSTQMEVEAQKYFQPIFERLRAQPDDTLLSDLVNTEVPGWGRPMNDNELHAEMMADTFVGGSETSTNALSAGMMLLIQSPDQWRRLKTEPELVLPTLVEEVLRLESPGQGLFRTAAVDSEIGGVLIPAGSRLNLRYAAANRDDSVFDDPDRFDAGREEARNHLAFGFGAHYCLGAPLARRELLVGFRAMVERLDEIWFVDGANDFAHHPNFVLRALKELHIGFTPA